jgi:hypothetical protein
MEQVPLVELLGTGIDRPRLVASARNAVPAWPTAAQ